MEAEAAPFEGAFARDESTRTTGEMESQSVYLWHSTGTLPVLCVCVVVVPPYPSPAGVVVVADGTGPSGEDDSTLPWWLCMSIGAVGE